MDEDGKTDTPTLDQGENLMYQIVFKWTSTSSGDPISFTIAALNVSNLYASRLLNFFYAVLVKTCSAGLHVCIVIGDGEEVKLFNGISEADVNLNLIETIWDRTAGRHNFVQDTKGHVQRTRRTVTAALLRVELGTGFNG